MNTGTIPALPYDPVRLRRLAETITAELGIKMPEGKLTMLHGRMQRRVNQLGITSLAEYERRLRDPVHAKAELVELLDLATTNKTDFFREPAHFTYLIQSVIPELARGRDRWACRVWCAGCSSGQEVYTLAMVLDDYGRSHPGFDFSIIATDISTRILREAIAATYPVALIEPVPPVMRQRYLLRGTGPRSGWVRVVPELRAKVGFRRLNFMDEHYPLGELDVVFFRNVMIYFDRATQKQVLERQCKLLRPGGYLFVGHTESVSGLGVPLTPRKTSVLQRLP
ncbi:MAG TPA: protein-glutamate O-methyltransferase CheR [Kofleriaceae bacterium]|nr:protein-glutamate O-methyltransferase CheR [Kofleriaceae bacterium]